MKNKYLYSILVCLFLLVGKVEVVYGQEWYESATWTSQTIKENITINLTQDIELNGTITIDDGYTLTIENISGKDCKIQATDKTIFINNGSLIINGAENSRVVLDGGANFKWTDNHSEMPYMRLTEGEGNIKIGEAIKNAGELSLSYVTIQNVNSSDNNGGAILTKSNKAVSLNNCIIQLCKARLGSAIMLDGGGSGEEGVALKINNSLITKCVSGGDASGANNTGGAIRSYGSTHTSLYLSNVTMSYNYAMREYSEYNNTLLHDGNGGALFWNGRGTTDTKCVIDGCTFTNNMSEDNGGAIKAQGTIEFVNNVTTICDNKAPNGAGLYIEGYTGGALNKVICTIDYDLNDFLVIKNNSAVSYEYDGNWIPGKGAGVHFYLGKEMTLMTGSTININMNGATIQNNKIEGDGGLGAGIYFEDTAPKEKDYTFNINLNYGKLLGNESTAYGGGMYISAGNVMSEAIEGKEMVVTENTASQEGGGIYVGEGSFTMNTTGKIEANIAASGNGGGIYVGGDFTMMSGTISRNVVTQGNGGGVFIDGGKLTFSNGSISGNQAGLNHNGNGGGICLLNGQVEITDGTINNNESGQYGGGLYVYNSEETERSASFTGGNIIQNEARYGGGICVDGNINLKIGAVTVDENEAINGGGICLLNGAKMDFGEGYIRNNKVSAIGTLQEVTAFQKSITEVNGIGGGVYLDSNTSLTFSVVKELGLYDNFANNGADDIFANGKETAVSYLDGSNVIPGLPVVKTMKLAGFSVAGDPYWVEDYIEGDMGYANGTNKKVEMDDIRRYRTSIQNLKEVYKIESVDDLKGASEKYLCLAIGHDIVYVTIVKQGLAEGESAIFTIESVKDGQEDTSNVWFC